MKQSRYVSVLSMCALAAVILSASAPGIVAQPSDEPARSRPAPSEFFDDSSPSKPNRLYRVVVRNDCDGACAVVRLANLPGPSPEVSDRGGIGGVFQTFDLTIVKDADHAFGTDFPFHSSFGPFTLDDAVPDDGDAFGDSIHATLPISATVVEQTPRSWVLGSIVCMYMDIDTSITYLSDQGQLLGFAIVAVPGDYVNCTFHNRWYPTSAMHLPLVSNSYGP